MGVIVLLELADGADGDDVDPEAVCVVRAAGADPDAPEYPLAMTLCGRDMGEMLHSHYRPAYGQPWFPPELEARRCRECDAVVRRS